MMLMANVQMIHVSSTQSRGRGRAVAVPDWVMNQYFVVEVKYQLIVVR